MGFAGPGTVPAFLFLMQPCGARFLPTVVRKQQGLIRQHQCLPTALCAHVVELRAQRQTGPGRNPYLTALIRVLKVLVVRPERRGRRERIAREVHGVHLEGEGR